MVFGVFNFLQKMNERIQLYYYDSSSWLVLVHFLEVIEDTKKPFWNYLTFSIKYFCILNEREMTVYENYNAIAFKSCIQKFTV